MLHNKQEQRKTVHCSNAIITKDGIYIGTVLQPLIPSVQLNYHHIFHTEGDQYYLT